MSKQALSHIETLAQPMCEQANHVIKNVLLMSNVSHQRLHVAQRALYQHGRIAFHFHPDRVDSRGLNVTQGLLKDGAYKSQFETHTSNGHLSPELGGSRDHWENQLFGGVYAGVKHRPKYGALDLGLNPIGPAPRFGSCYFVSSPKLLHRATFSYLDSYRLPKEKATINSFEVIMAALLSEAFERQSAIGVHPFKPEEVIAHFEQLSNDLDLRFSRQASANLDHYIEAQVHGDISLDTDIDLLVADPHFKETPIASLLNQIAQQYRIRLCYHSGYQMLASEVPNNFRGASMPSLAQKLACNGKVTPLQLGQAAQALVSQTSSWSERGAHEKSLQQLKLLWHVLVKYGVKNTA
ncbi:DUF3626 domain-containing protein [Shewanella maritima]|uniref:DUF3626 domain-containing protein n=1 Tax=Shewanella maritima TaxID=2520507 RepID=UPI0037357300